MGYFQSTCALPDKLFRAVVAEKTGVRDDTFSGESLEPGMVFSADVVYGTENSEDKGCGEKHQYAYAGNTAFSLIVPLQPDIIYRSGEHVVNKLYFVVGALEYPFTACKQGFPVWEVTAHLLPVNRVASSVRINKSVLNI